jgi:hypothetical protein
LFICGVPPHPGHTSLCPTKEMIELENDIRYFIWSENAIMNFELPLTGLSFNRSTGTENQSRHSNGRVKGLSLPSLPEQPTPAMRT